VKNTKTILVTGGAGFIGSHLCEFLLKSGHRVICVDNFVDFYHPLIKQRNISSLLGNPEFTLNKIDIRDRNSLEMSFRKSRPELVIHLAAMAGVRPSIEDPFQYFDVNVSGTLILLETMRKFAVNDLIFASSSSVYGNNSKLPFSESDPVDKQISPYASSKRACELLCYTYHSLFEFNIFCLRFFTVYGPRQRPDLAIHKFTEKILKNKPVQIFGDGNTSRDYTYITDVIEGINNAIRHLNGFEIYNIAESQSISLNREESRKGVSA
jgi:UDP-glucuronate 4-epimerase